MVLKLIRTHVNRTGVAGQRETVWGNACCRRHTLRGMSRSTAAATYPLARPSLLRGLVTWWKAPLAANRFATSRWLHRSGEATTIFVGFVDRPQLIHSR
jgi:hypothetical protein